MNPEELAEHTMQSLQRHLPNVEELSDLHGSQFDVKCTEALLGTHLTLKIFLCDPEPLQIGHIKLNYSRQDKVADVDQLYFVPQMRHGFGGIVLNHCIAYYESKAAPVLADSIATIDLSGQKCYLQTIAHLQSKYRLKAKKDPTVEQLKQFYREHGAVVKNDTQI